jgi:hypothetical protein
MREAAIDGLIALTVGGPSAECAERHPDIGQISGHPSHEVVIALGGTG